MIHHLFLSEPWLLTFSGLVTDGFIAPALSASHLLPAHFISLFLRS